MLKLGSTQRAIAMTVATFALASGAAVGLGGTASAATGAPDASTTDWFHLYLANDGNSTGRYFDVCNWQSSANTVYVGVTDYTYGNAVELQDVRTGWTTYGANINFSSGGCEEFYILGRQGSAFVGYIKTPNYYSTGVVVNN
jgi:hypothetical protein